MSTEQQSVVVPRSAFTLAGFREWATAEEFPDRVRVTFLEGAVDLDMSNEEPQTHVAVKTELIRVLAGLVKEHKLGRFYSDGLLLTNTQADLSNNPDALFFTFETLAANRVRLVPRPGQQERYRELEGTPDWLLEVVSDSSVQKETQRLRQAYHRAGIEEYWLVDARGEKIVFQILIRRKTRYSPAASLEGWQRSVVFGRAFRLESQADELGLLEYTLRVREAG